MTRSFDKALDAASKLAPQDNEPQTFKKGDQVVFTDKYGQRLVGTYEKLEMVPGRGGDVERAVVRAYPFGDDMEVSCLVPPAALGAE